MALRPSASASSYDASRIVAVLGPTNTGKTHLAIERLCAHSSGAIGFPLRLLAREVYNRVCAIKGEESVALITGEERIEPKGARWFLCTVEAMPMERDLAFIALDEVQLAADRERGHIFTDRLLHARGREETMFLGSSIIEPLIRTLVPSAEITTRPRFSTLTHIGPKKLSRIPPRSAIVAFSAEQVYTIAEMLRRFRGGSAVVMGALSPETRNKQVDLYQSGEVDYLVATDAIGMGLNLDIEHVAFASLSRFDGVRHRRLFTPEMAQIAGRAGRHQRDGTFGTLTGTRSHDSEFQPEEVYAIEEHRFPPLTKLLWRNSQPRFSTVETLIDDLTVRPERPELVIAPEAIDLAVLRRLSNETDIAPSLRSPRAIKRFWDVCSLPDFRQSGVETHARFVARLWQDLKGGFLGANYVSQSIAHLDNVSGDLHTLQGRIAAIRSWAYITQRPDWVLAKDEMAARARSVEARLSDALHARLTERFVNRRTAVLMKKLGADAGLLPVTLADDTVLVDGEQIGRLKGFRFQVDPDARHGDHKLFLAAAEKHLPALLKKRAHDFVVAAEQGEAGLELKNGVIIRDGEALARLKPGKSPLVPGLVPEPALEALEASARQELLASVQTWLNEQLAPLEPLSKLDEASTSKDAGPELRALLIRLVEAGGILERQPSGIDALDKTQRTMLAKLGVRVGALDLFVPTILRPAPLHIWRELAALQRRRVDAPHEIMPPVLPVERRTRPPGYRHLGQQWIRLDMGEKLLREAHTLRIAAERKPFVLDPAKPISMGLTIDSYTRLMRAAGFQPRTPPALAEGVFGPPQPTTWRWRPPRRNPQEESKPVKSAPPVAGNAFASLAALVR